MINFHKYSFLDCKKLKRYIENDDYWICQYNPIWLFVWSDYYKPEICFRHDFVFIRFMMPDVGMCYYPPLGKGDLKQAMKDMEEDANEKGFDFYLAPVAESLYPHVSRLSDKLYENRDFDTYICSSDALSFFKEKEYKEKRKLCEKFEKQHRDAVYKPIKKDDFGLILEFITDWNQEHSDRYNTPYFYKQLNMIKKCMDHLYELDLFGIILMDEKKVYGVAIASLIGNVATLHVNLSLDSIPGAAEELMQCFARTTSLRARYISLEMDSGDLVERKKKSSYKPVKLEKYYATFNL